MSAPPPTLNYRQLLRAELMLLDEPSRTDEEVLRRLSGLLAHHGLVRPSHADAVVTRERNFPTGLELGAVNAALPHSDPEHVVGNAIAVAVLHAPVQFHHMADLERTVDVHVVIMLAINDQPAMVPLLARLALVLQDGQTLRQIADATSADAGVSVLGAALAAARA